MPGQLERIAGLFKLTPREAVRFLESKKIIRTQNWDDLESWAHDFVFTIANVMKASVLQTIKDTLTTAVAEGWTVDRFKEELGKTKQTAGWSQNNDYRLKTIFNTNVYHAYSYQRYVKQRTVAEGQESQIYWIYVSTITDFTTNICRYLHRKAVLSNDPIWDVIYPLNHFNCRGRVLTGDRDTVKAGQYTVTTGKAIQADFKRLGIVIPKGFDRAPKRFISPDINRLDPDIRKLVAEEETE